MTAYLDALEAMANDTRLPEDTRELVDALIADLTLLVHGWAEWEGE